MKKKIHLIIASILILSIITLNLTFNSSSSPEIDSFLSFVENEAIAQGEWGEWMDGANTACYSGGWGCACDCQAWSQHSCAVSGCSLCFVGANC